MNLCASRKNALRTRSLMTSAFFSRIFNLSTIRLFHVSALYILHGTENRQSPKAVRCVQNSLIFLKKKCLCNIGAACLETPPRADVIEERFLTVGYAIVQYCFLVIKSYKSCSLTCFRAFVKIAKSVKILSPRKYPVVQHVNCFVSADVIKERSLRIPLGP